jgi:serine/threonine-protein kinase
MSHPRHLALPLSREPSRVTGSMPADLVADASRRLSVAAFICGGVYLVTVLLYLFAFQEAAFVLGRVVGIVSTVVSIAFAVYLRRKPRSWRFVEVAGSGYEFLIAFSIAIVEYWRIGDYNHTQALPTVSWTCVVIILFPLLVPMKPRVALVASLLAASANPIGLVLALELNHQPALSAEVVGSLLAPPFICAIMAVVPAQVLTKMGRAVQRARQLGSYQLVEQLGRGGMGEVWRAKHRLLARPAAVKLIRPEVLGAQDDSDRRVLLERFQREAQATASLESPHTVELYDFGVSEKDGTFYYVMEYIRGIDLDELVEEHGPLPPGRVVHLLTQACDSLDEAHAVGLIHRDIKPANLIVGRRGRRLDYLRVLDFGLVKRSREREEAKLTADDVMPGTPAFLSPESVTGDDPVDARSDLYALGAVAYWLLTGRLVFEAETPLKVALAHVTREPVPPSELAERDVPVALERLVMDCLAKRPQDRPQTAQELMERLLACETSGEVEPWTAEDAERWWRRHHPEVMAGEAE